MLCIEGYAGGASQRLIFISLIGRFNRTMTRYLSVGHIFTVNILYATYAQPTHHLLPLLLRTMMPALQSAKMHCHICRLWECPVLLPVRMRSCVPLLKEMSAAQ